MQLNEKPAPIVFHYNKAHNGDVAIPPWIIKFKGQTYYISHLDIDPGVGFSTKESPDNEHTKGALKIKGLLDIYEIDGKTNARVF